MSDAHLCDRPGHESKEDAMFYGPAAIVIQSPRGELELCPQCVEEFNEWWNPDDGDEEGETIAENLG